jgi:signal transduction histidine kinase
MSPPDHPGGANGEVASNSSPPAPCILLVDDDQANLAALEAALAPLGQGLVRAPSGRDALRHLLRQQFAVVLLDIRLRDLDGFEVARLIRERPVSRHTPIIFLTAFGDVGEVRKLAYGLGAADFIIKPFPSEFLRAKVEVFVELHRKQQTVERLLVEAREAERAKSEFLNMAAHELRTPLSVVIGYLSMFTDGTLGEPPPKWRGPLETLNLKVGELNKLVEDLLAAARLNAGAAIGVETDYDLRQVALESVERARSRARLLGAQIHLELSEESMPVRGDPAQVGCIVDNLLNNALTYARGRPWVRLTLSRDDRVRLLVEDRGIGIAEGMRERVFDRFVRVHDPSGPRPGTGLGLYISRELARRQGGDVFVVESEPGRGSTFALTLPARPSDGLPGPVSACLPAP